MSLHPVLDLRPAPRILLVQVFLPIGRLVLTIMMQVWSVLMAWLLNYFLLIFILFLSAAVFPLTSLRMSSLTARTPFGVQAVQGLDEFYTDDVGN